MTHATRCRRVLVLVGAMIVTTSCAMGIVPVPVETPQPLSSIPGPSVLRLVGAIAQQETRDQTTSYRLANGRDVTVDASSDRLIVDTGGSPAILVMGRDSHGDWAAVVGHQDGTPPDCYILRDRGYELGDSIAIDGVRWPKAASFESGGQAPPIAHPYPGGTRFCLDDQARVRQLIAP